MCVHVYWHFPTAERDWVGWVGHHGNLRGHVTDLEVVKLKTTNHCTLQAACLHSIEWNTVAVEYCSYGN